MPDTLVILSRKPRSKLIEYYYFYNAVWVLERWLVQGCGQWECRPWKWRDLQRNAGARLVLTISQRKIKPIQLIILSCYCQKKNYRPYLFMAYTLIDHRINAIKWSKLGAARARLVVLLKFWTFYGVISMVDKSHEECRPWKISGWFDKL